MRINLSLDDVTIERLDRLAEAWEMSRSNVVRVMARVEFEREERQGWQSAHQPGPDVTRVRSSTQAKRGVAAIPKGGK